MFWEAPDIYQNILCFGNSQNIYQKIIRQPFFAIPLGLSILQISITILNRLYLTLFFVSDTNPCPTNLIIQLKIGSLFPIAASSSIPLPNGLLAPPTMPSIGDCFPCGSVDSGKYVLYSSVLSRRVCWRISLAMSICGQGISPFLWTTTQATLPHLESQTLARSISSMHGGTPRMNRWRVFLQRIQCGINFMSAFFISLKMQNS